MQPLGTRQGPLELWGGVECTVNRVGDQWFDQLEKNGHAARITDLDLFADLGIRTLRYPLLWERTAPDGCEKADWRWGDARLGRMQELGIEPILGLVHHGSGPAHTSLLDPAFPDKLADYARAVAQRYPWVTAYTPVNEPLTTARFSGLYGHWYPHGSDDLTFVRTLLIQCRAIAQAMAAVREVNPKAVLVQTDDLGKTYSTNKLRYQADFENERRWLSFDLLCGRVNQKHPLWKYFRRLGIESKELEWFLESPCPPDILGINHYLTSERFLDERCERYPELVRGSNGWHTYVDLEAVRVCEEGPSGPTTLLREAWERYGLPMAVTEAHLGCTREEQIRWLAEVWESAQSLQRHGVDLRAVTIWALLGAFDWDSLVTRSEGHYEPGAFDLRAPEPRPTGLAAVARDLADGRVPSHPVLAVPGWWHRPERLLYPAVHRNPRETEKTLPLVHGKSVRPIMIVGGKNSLAGTLVRLCDTRALAYCHLTLSERDGHHLDRFRETFDQCEPWAVISADGYGGQEEDLSDEDYSRVLVDGPRALAELCVQRHLPLMQFSSAAVFGTDQSDPCDEDKMPRPTTVYGYLQRRGEREVQAIHPEALIVRTGLCFGGDGEGDFLRRALRALQHGESVPVPADHLLSPAYVPDLLHACLDLLIDGERGVWHLANPGEMTWTDFLGSAATLAGIDSSGLQPRAMQRIPTLTTHRGALLSPLHSALVRSITSASVDLQGKDHDGIPFSFQDHSRPLRVLVSAG